MADETGAVAETSRRSALRVGATASALIVALLASACDRAPAMPTAAMVGASKVTTAVEACLPSSSSSPRIETIASGLDVPWDVVFLPDGRALITERPGRIRVVGADGVLEAEPWASIDVHSPAGGEVGLLGIDARQAASGETEVYVTATVRRAGMSAVSRLAQRIGRRVVRLFDPEGGQPTTLQVVRLIDRGGRGVEPQVIVAGLPSGELHGGGGLRFGPDGLLYTANGDGTEPARAQLDASRRGKILRYLPDGSIPMVNPIPGSPVFATGVRHVQGLDWLPTGELVAIDHGPTGLAVEQGRTGDDELNVLASAGVNLGWPIVTGTTHGGGFVSPVVAWTPAIAPAGVAVYRGFSAAWSGSVFVTGLKGSVRRIVLHPGPTGASARCEEVLLANTNGRLRLVRTAPDGTLWVGTSNRDGRGQPRPSDDLVFRIHPPDAVD